MQDDKPHVHVDDKPHAAHEAAPGSPGARARKELSIWFFCGILMLAYGLVLLVQGYIDLSHPPATVLAELHPTLKWGVLLTLFGAFYTVVYRPGKG